MVCLDGKRGNKKRKLPQMRGLLWEKRFCASTGKCVNSKRYGKKNWGAKSDIENTRRETKGGISLSTTGKEKGKNHYSMRGKGTGVHNQRKRRKGTKGPLILTSNTQKSLKKAGPGEKRGTQRLEKSAYRWRKNRALCPFQVGPKIKRKNRTEGRKGMHP